MQPPSGAASLGTIINVGTRDVPQTDPFNEAKEKATGARVVARVLVFTFAATIGATFLTLALIYVLSASPAQAKDFVAAFTGMVPVMENFITKIFGPLLAFVLGYYFGEKGKTASNQS
jgi:putative flippase GtrA